MMTGGLAQARKLLEAVLQRRRREPCGSRNASTSTYPWSAGTSVIGQRKALRGFGEISAGMMWPRVGGQRG